jgi:hypothetical protein
MDGNMAVLEYRASEADGGSESWGFRIKSSDGQTLIESARTFGSQAEAEMSFVSMIKLIALNRYAIQSSALHDADMASPVAAGGENRGIIAPASCGVVATS